MGRVLALLISFICNFVCTIFLMKYTANRITVKLFHSCLIFVALSILASNWQWNISIISNECLPQSWLGKGWQLQNCFVMDICLKSMDWYCCSEMTGYEVNYVKFYHFHAEQMPWPFYDFLAKSFLFFFWNTLECRLLYFLVLIQPAFIL